MTPEQMRELADILEPMAAAPVFERLDIPGTVAFLRQCAEQRPDGWQLVPVEPTEAMRSAGGHVNSEWLNDDAPLYESRYAMSMDGVWSAMLAAAPAAPQAEKHPDEAAVDRFAAAMKSKLAEKRRQGKSGWDDPRCPTEHLAALLREHVVKGDPLDVGNFAMMLWCRGGSTNETQAEPKRLTVEVSLAAGHGYHGYWGVAIVSGVQRFALAAPFAVLTEADEYAEILRKALGITGDSDAD